MIPADGIPRARVNSKKKPPENRRRGRAVRPGKSSCGVEKSLREMVTPEGRLR